MSRLIKIEVNYDKTKRTYGKKNVSGGSAAGGDRDRTVMHSAIYQDEETFSEITEAILSLSV